MSSFCRMEIFKEEFGKRQLCPFLLLPVPGPCHGTTSLVHAGAFDHLRYCQFLLERENQLPAFAMHSASFDEDRDALAAAQ